jgi:predicted MFS family arabinose efflux permease
MPVASTVGMELAKDGKTGHRLGQMNAIRNLAAIAGSGLVFVGFKYFSFTYKFTYTISAIIFVVGMIMMALMQPQKIEKTNIRHFLKLRKEYTLFYILAVLYGSRKQIFITFGPWVIVTIYGKPTQTLATLILIGGVIGILFQPILGKAIDKLGEKVVLVSEAVLLVFVCLGYAFSKSILPLDIAFLITCICYLLDQVLMSVSMARSTYMKKIALRDTDIQPALSAAITIDHFFSIGVALIGGVIWNHFGFKYVFLFGVIIAVINFFATMRIKLPVQLPTTLASD